MRDTKRIVLAGGSGFLGQALAAHFLRAGWDTIVLTRHPGQLGGQLREVAWDGRTVGQWAEYLNGARVIVNLTGKSVNCRYTARNRKEINDSRVDATRALGQAISRCSNPPPVWINSSTATIYKHTYGPAWEESGEIAAVPEAKDAFSVEVANSWERAFNEVPAPTRKIAIRSAMVLGMAKNSVFPALRRLVRLGLGGKLGNGKQYVSWIHVEDFCRAVGWLIARTDISGPVNVAAPNPLPNRDVMRILRQTYHMPFGLPAATWMLEVGAFLLRTETELIIKSRRVVPCRLLESGYRFKFPDLREAFDDLALKSRQ